MIRRLAPSFEVSVETFGPGHGGFPTELFGEDFDADRFFARFRDELVFVDIETCGLGDTVVFLVGVLRYTPGALERGEAAFRFEGVLAADPSGEAELIDRSVTRLAEAPSWVSFNGKCFDVPRLRKRAFRHRVETFPEPGEHTDLLHEVRRRWKGELPDCKLSTVERRLLGLERGPNDVPGREVPARYWDSVTMGRRELLAPILEHNRRDVLAMVALLGRLAAEKDPTGRSARRS